MDMEQFLYDFFISLASSVTSNITRDVFNNLLQKEEIDTFLVSSFDRAMDKFKEIHGYCPCIESYKNLCIINDGHEDTKSELRDYFDKELRKKQQTYLWLIEHSICNQRKETKVLDFLDLDEREKYKDKNDFYNIHQGCKIKIDDLFVEPNYCGYKYDLKTKEYLEEQHNENIEVICNSLLQTHHVLFILGHYGSGKTFLSKKIMKEIHDGFTCFLDASRISNQNNLDVFLRVPIDYIIDRYKKCYIFIDSLDDVCSQNNKILQSIKTLAQRCENLFFVVNFRKPDGVKISDILLNLSMIFKDKVGIVELKRFNTTQQSQWIELYNSFYFDYEVNRYERKLIIGQKEFENANKNLKKACQIPLVLLMLLESNSVNIKTKRQKWYKLFCEFVDKTINGKFSEERPIHAFLDDRNLVSGYKDTIIEIAFSILKYNTSIEIIKQPEDYDDFFLDPNNQSYTIGENLVKEIVAKKLGKIPSDLDIILYLNCYFFDYYNKSWKFKDNNILFFLCASKYCSVLKQISDKYIDEKCLSLCAKNLRKEFDSLSIHPIVIEFILDQIEDCKPEERNILLSFIKSLIVNNYIINVPKKQYFKINYNKIKTDILLAIIFIRFNNESYQNKQLNHCFKSISQYYSFIKIIDQDLASIILRYFRYVPIKVAEFKRINFKGYNLNYSRLSNVRINQCKFYDTPMEGVTFNDVRFDFCYLKNIKIKDCGGKADFKLCHLLHTYFVYTNDNSINTPIELHFKNSILDDVLIDLGSVNYTNTAPLITFEKCEIRQIKIINGCIKLNIDMLSYMTNQILLKNVHIINNIEFTKDTTTNILSKNLQKYDDYDQWLSHIFGNLQKNKLTINYGNNDSYEANDLL